MCLLEKEAFILTSELISLGQWGVENLISAQLLCLCYDTQDDVRIKRVCVLPTSSL